MKPYLFVNLKATFNGPFLQNIKANLKTLKGFFSKKIIDIPNRLAAFYCAHTDFRQLCYWEIVQSFDIFFITLHKVHQKHKTFSTVTPWGYNTKQDQHLCFYIQKSIEIGKSLMSYAPMFLYTKIY